MRRRSSGKPTRTAGFAGQALLTASSPTTSAAWSPGRRWASSPAPGPSSTQPRPRRRGRRARPSARSS
eukprot:13975850-Alexandrium_andersonii.AAC.1